MKGLKKVKDWIRTQIHNQFVSHDNVVSFHRLDPKTGRFYLNSPAGLIVYKPKSLADVTRFRDKWINKFETLSEQKDSNKFYNLYVEIRKNEKVKYRANLRTRIKCNLLRFI